MKVHTEGQFGVLIGLEKFQDNIFIHYQDIDILNCLVFLTVHDKLKTVGIFALSQLVLELQFKLKIFFLFLTMV